jgi:hypothetical protein
MVVGGRVKFFQHLDKNKWLTCSYRQGMNTRPALYRPISTLSFARDAV